MGTRENVNTQDLAIKKFMRQFVPSEEGIPSVDNSKKNIDHQLFHSVT